MNNSEKKNIFSNFIDKLKNKPSKPTAPKKEMSKMQKIWLSVGAVIAVIGVAALIIAIVASASNNVNVYNVSELAMMDSWMYQTDGSGNVTGENMQTIYLSDTQKVTDVFVEEGQEVKVGDKIMSYDTTLSNLEIEKKNLEVLQLELALNQAKEQLVKINALKPYVPAPEEEEEVDLGVKLTTQTLESATANGSKTDPYIYTIVDDSFACGDEFMTSLLGGGNVVYVVLISREDNMSKGEIVQAWGICFKKYDDAKSMTFFDPSEFLISDEPVPEPSDNSSGYTVQEIYEMRVAQLEYIAEAEAKYRLADIEYRQMMLEVDTGVILSKVDGIVTLVGDQEESIANYTPFIKIAGGSGYRISSTVSEFMLEKINIGQPVTITSWDNGMTYEGTVAEIITLPSNEYNYYGGVSSSYYPIMISVSADADLFENQYVQVTFDFTQGETSLYMPDAYIRTENGRSYAYIKGEDGKLEKRELVTGASLWGSYTQIISGFTIDDMIAFPYGNNVKDGAKAVDSTLDELYGSMY